MLKRIVSEVMLTLLFMSMLTLAFNTQPVNAEKSVFQEEIKSSFIDQSISTENFTVIFSQDMTYSLKDHRIVDAPEGYYPEYGGLLITEYPYSSFASLVTGLCSPYSLGPIYIYDYTGDSFRNISLSSPFGGGFVCPGTVTPVCKDNKTYLFTASKFQGEGVWHKYQAGNISWPFSAVIDYPDFMDMTSLNLVLPAAELGYSPDQELWIERSWCLDGYKLCGYGAVSRYIGGTPRGRYLYFVNLTDPEFLDVTKPHEVYPTKEIPWDAPLESGFYNKVSDEVLLYVHWASDTDNYVFYNITNDTWRTFTASGWNVIWHKKEGGYLYLLIKQYEGSYLYKYIFNRVNLTGLDNLEKLTVNPVETIWEKTFQKDYANYYPIHMVEDDKLLVFEGSWGYPTEWGPILDCVSTYELMSGKLISEENLNIDFPYSNSYLRNLQYPFIDAETIYGSFIIDLDRNLIHAINLTDIMNYITLKTDLHLCKYCSYSFFLTDYDPQKIDLLGIMYNYTNRSLYLTSIEIRPVDTTPPAITILSPENKTYTTTSIPLTFTVNETASWMGYSLDGGLNITITGNTTLTELSDGVHSLAIYANDTAGNMGASDTVYFTIVSKTLLGTGWGWMRITHKEYVYGLADLYKIGDTQIELVITYQGEEYSRIWNIIYHREYRYSERYLCYSKEWGFLVVGLHKRGRWQFWYAVGKDTIAFGFPRFQRLRLMPI